MTRHVLGIARQKMATPELDDAACIRGLLQETQRQLELVTSPPNYATHNNGAGAEEGVECLGRQGPDYIRLLGELRSKIAGRLLELADCPRRSCGANFNAETPPESSPDSKWEGVYLSDESLLWKIPAFSNQPASFMVPSRWLEHSKSIQASRSTHGIGQSLDTAGLWKDAHLEAWTTTSQSSLLLVQSRFTTRHLVGKFGIELLDYLEEKRQQTVLILDFRLREDESTTNPVVDTSSLGVLRQIAIQLLMKIQHPHLLKFLAIVINFFQKASTSEDWFQILRFLMLQFAQGSLYLVVDLGILGSHFEDAQRWPSEFERIFTGLRYRTPKTLFKIALLNYRAPTSPSVATSSAHVISVAESSPLPPARNVIRRQQYHRSARQDPIYRPKLYEPPQETSSTESTIGVAQMSKSNDIALTGGLQSLGITETSTCTASTTEGEKKRPTLRNDFEIAIICALPLEADAVTALLDKNWEDEGGLPFQKAAGDTNAYSAGVIGAYNVIIVHMPGMGKVSAAVAAACCRLGFPGIKLVLVVGICGAVPFKPNGEEIVLGDVIISDAVIQYDIGRRLPERFARKDSLLDALGRPSMEIRGMLAKLKGRLVSHRLNSKMAKYMENLRHNPQLGAAYPGSDKDVLFESDYRHTGDEQSCEKAGCDGSIVVRQRLQRTDSTSDLNPTVHVGLIASGDSVMKSGLERDAIAAAEGIIAFEMEGAGVWDSFPCVVIKGVCDYADSHKSKTWQRYAAATAAACMKAFLELWTPSASGVVV